MDLAASEEPTSSVNVLRILAAVYMSPRTLARWREWWRKAFADGPFWKAAGAMFVPAVSVDLLPLSLLDRFLGTSAERLTRLLRFLAPITTTSAGGAMAF